MGAWPRSSDTSGPQTGGAATTVNLETHCLNLV